MGDTKRIMGSWRGSVSKGHDGSYLETPIPFYFRGADLYRDAKGTNKHAMLQRAGPASQPMYFPGQHGGHPIVLGSPYSGTLAIGVLNKDGYLVMKEVPGGATLQSRASRYAGTQRGSRGKGGWFILGDCGNESLRLGGKACAWCHSDLCSYS